MKTITVKEACAALRIAFVTGSPVKDSDAVLKAIARLLRAQERRVRELEGSYEEYPYWVGYRILRNCRGIKFYNFDRRTNRRVSVSTVMCNPGMTLAERQEEITCAASYRNIDINFSKARQAGKEGV